MSSQMLSVMPKPPAAFSPLMITQSSFQRSRRAGSRSATATRPGRPTISPRKRRRIRKTLARGSNDFGIGDDDVDAAVVRLHGYGRDLLDREGNPDREHRVARFKGGDRGVEMTLAVADPPALPVERRERDQHGPGGDLGRFG